MRGAERGAFRFAAAHANSRLVRLTSLCAERDLASIMRLAAQLLSATGQQALRTAADLLITSTTSLIDSAREPNGLGGQSKKRARQMLGIATRGALPVGEQGKVVPVISQHMAIPRYGVSSRKGQTEGEAVVNRRVRNDINPYKFAAKSRTD
ncbi:MULTISPECIES: hypothetical protein [unclassified Mesorhizobium]|uniref:hypothetical protein n=1 Tax=unclassified Mesorhizobium TaxID=325217 RepID=UPI000FCAD403|nr:MULTISPECIES: hypothetical protein [unclassified Mesorhizobium]RUV64302.1 hypothetical protein EOA85_02175 [Mesorhizobium sp. M5C.F.Ca.IN.020.29.1.1]RWK56356.1 MAG: hypothetical protein EOR49_34990 [Mesorhizobium sp.]RWM43029.1 MAG: hypothetical protein EOR76_31520 [Mesorhizobium sp.]RWM45854.1 MAG: hypothetical protein EOR79_35345 [Mesorhizobium sp.]RWM46104.1 MAG: hypothetical protein EOR78_33120 [Mesorhizobium sp.]